ncbi:hypothetical protein [Rhizorhabdus argentea]|uniref:hypothetical protein n=1 Tax=Rhizorhabdus argentea TaxID=1387174 RepID=UPI0030ED75E4
MSVAVGEAVVAPILVPALDRHKAGRIPLALWCCAAILLAGLFGRIMVTPLGHDEQIHIAAAQLIFREPLYGALGYNHLPGLPLLLGGLYAAVGADHLLLTGRLLIFLCWIAAASVMWMIASHASGGHRTVGAAFVLVLMAGTLLGPAGTLVTNNFLPIPFAMLGVHLFAAAPDQRPIRPWMLFAAGFAIGFAVILKISYVFLVPPIAVAALLAPLGMTNAERFRRVIWPLVGGGVLGALPGLVPLISGPQTLYAHTVSYFTGGHLAYWQHSTAPKAMSAAAKMLVADGIWFAGSGLLAAMLAGTCGWTLAQSGWRRLTDWPILLVAAITALAAIMSFVPSPAFPQYYEPPVPFMLILALLCYRQLDVPAQRRMQSLIGTAGAIALAIILPRVLPAVPAVGQPARWTGNVVHAQGARIRTVLEQAGVDGRVATLAPIIALEGGLPIYREFAAGPFVYRVADYLPPAQRRHFVTTSPRGLSAFLDANPPAAIVTGQEGELDRAFVDYARSRRYVPVDIGPQPQLFVRAAHPPAR